MKKLFDFLDYFFQRVFGNAGAYRNRIGIVTGNPERKAESITIALYRDRRSVDLCFGDVVKLVVISAYILASAGFSYDHFAVVAVIILHLKDLALNDRIIRLSIFTVAVGNGDI